MAPTLSQYFCFSFSSLAPKHHIVLLFSLLSTENARHKSGIEKKWLAFCSNRLFFSSASDMHTKMEFWKHQFYFFVSWLRQLNPEKYNCPAILYTAGIRTWYLSILVCHRAILYARPWRKVTIIRCPCIKRNHAENTIHLEKWQSSGMRI